MPPEDQASSLDKVQQRLYSPQANVSFTEPSLTTRPANTSPLPPVSEHWEAPPPPPPPKPKKKGLSWAVWFLIGASVFFIIAIGASSIYLLRGGSTVTSSNINIIVPPTTSVASGATVPIVVTIQNHNPSNIINSSIAIDFPDGTRSADDVTQPLVRYTDDLGTIVAGGSVNRTVQAVMFGSVNQSITIPITVTYHTANSNATFTKELDYKLTITSSPITITALSVPSAASGQPFLIQLTVRSNATTPLTNVAVEATYPTGFNTTTGGTATTSGPLYNIGTLQAGQQKDITIGGVLTGTDDTAANFQFTVGTTKNDGSKTLGLAYASTATSITLTKPFLSATLALNNSNSNPTIVTAGQAVSGLISWINTLSSSIQNGQITIKITGSALDQSSVEVSNGYYSSSNNTIVLDGQTDPALQTLNPNASGGDTFSFASKTGDALSKIQNPTIQLSVGVSGVSGNGGTRSITNTMTRSVEIATNLGLTSKILHSTGPFSNTGPWPPKVGQPTTYTVQLGITNTVNSVAGAVVTAILPTYVTYTGQANPADGSVTYNDSNHTVTWKVGAIPADTGLNGTAPLTAAFQVSFTPSVSQLTMSPVLVGSQVLTGTDRFTGSQVQSTANALTTQASSDPAYQQSFGNVGN